MNKSSTFVSIQIPAIHACTCQLTTTKPSEHSLDLESSNGGGGEEQGTEGEAQSADKGLRVDARGSVVGGGRARRAGGGGIAVAIVGLGGITVVVIVVTAGASSDNDAGRRGGSELPILGSGGSVGGVAPAEDVGIASALLQQALGELGDGLVDGQAVEAAVVVVADDIGVATAGGHDLGVVGAEGQGADSIVDGRVVEGRAAGAIGGGSGGSGGGGHDDVGGLQVKMRLRLRLELELEI